MWAVQRAIIIKPLTGTGTEILQQVQHAELPYLEQHETSDLEARCANDRTDHKAVLRWQVVRRRQRAGVGKPGRENCRPGEIKAKAQTTESSQRTVVPA